MSGRACHPDPRDLERFLRGELSRRDAVAIIAHLLPGCPTCQERMEPTTDSMFHPGRAQGPPPAWREAEYDFPLFKAFSSARRYAAAQEQKSAAQAGLQAGEPPQPERPRREADRTFVKEVQEPPAPVSETRDRGGLHAVGGWSRCERLLEQSRRLRASDPEAMVMTASLAASSADRLDPRTYAPRQLADFQAEARAELGNALRVTGDTARAEHELTRAFELAQKGTGDAVLLVRILDFMASLYSDQRRFADACHLLDRLYDLHLGRGDQHLAGRTLISKGIAVGHASETGQAIHLLSEGLRRIDPQRDPRLALAAIHNLIWFLVEAGRLPEADGLLVQSRGLYACHGERLDLLKVLWLEGRIAIGLGDDERAQRALLQVRNGFEQAELPYDAALVGLDLAAVWLRQGRTAEIRRLLDEILTEFRARNIRREAIGAVLMLKEALRKDGASLALLQAVEADLQRLGREAGRG